MKENNLGDGDVFEEEVCLAVAQHDSVRQSWRRWCGKGGN